jgi:hypothetical protein
MRDAHGENITHAALEAGTNIIMRHPDSARLAIAEALIIKEESPAINRLPESSGH